MTTSADPALEARLLDLLASLTLDEKVLLTTGRDFWNTWPIERIGLRRILVSDGPSGVRGEVWDERSPSLNLPSATALSSSWDLAVAARYGAATAIEARRKGVDVVLGPTINLHRSPLGGRHFEGFSEDPHLTAELSAAYVAGVQQNGVGATPKHYIANDFETDRFSVDVVVGERALRELYLLAFEKSITHAGAWLVMSAYNSINGTTATESSLLETPLNSEWGFDGVVISDWTAVRSLASAEASQDLAMPGPRGAWGQALTDAVNAGTIDVAHVDRKALRILRLAARVGALEGFESAGPGATASGDDGIAFSREAAIEGTVLLRNTGILPLDAAAVASIAVIGHNARQARTQGGGSATVVPSEVIAPLDGIRRALPGVPVTYSLGAIVQEGVAELPLDQMQNPLTGEQGAHVRFIDARGTVVYEEDRFASSFVYFGGDAPVSELGTFEFTTLFTPDTTGSARLGFSSVGRGVIRIDGEVVFEGSATATGSDLGAAFLAPPSITTELSLVAGRAMLLSVEFTPESLGDGLSNAMSITIGVEPADSDADQLITDAAAAAASADVAIVVVGTNARVESEGYDRDSLALPGRQDDLVTAVLAANPRTIVVVNAGSPVEMPWRDDVEALLVTYFGGQQYGNAVASILTGASEPGGRLPTTWPVRMQDVPVLAVTPENGVVRYAEGIHIGYRAWLKHSTAPAYPFGFGLGYTTWRLHDLEVGPFADDVATVGVNVTNTGTRTGKQVVQVYAERPDSAVDRPVRWLVGFAVARVEPGQSQHLSIPVARRALAYWGDGWRDEPGQYVLRVGTSVTELPLSTTLTE